MANKDMSVRVINYSNARESATIAYMSSRGEVRSIYIHRDTFNKLMTGELDRMDVPGMSPSLEQIELRDALRKEVGKDYAKWFDTTTNEYLKNEANVKRPTA